MFAFFVLTFSLNWIDNIFGNVHIKYFSKEFTILIQNLARKYFFELSLLAIIIVWSSNNSAMKLGIMDMGPYLYNAMRLSLAAVLCWLWLYKLKKYKHMSLQDMAYLAFFSLIGFGLNQICLTYGLDKTTAGNASLASALMPIAVILLNRLFKGEVLPIKTLCGIAIAFFGVIFIILGSGKSISLDDGNMIGTLVVVLGQFGNAYYTIYAKDLLGKYSSEQIVSYIMTICALTFWLLSFMNVDNIDWSKISEGAWISVVYSGIFALWLGNIVWVKAVGKVGSTRTALYQYLLPIFSLVFAYILLGETLVWGQIVGTVCIVAGLIISRRN